MALATQIKIPDNPTPQQRRSLALYLIRRIFESDARAIGELTPRGQGWRTYYKSGGRLFAAEYDGTALKKWPINSLEDLNDEAPEAAGDL